VKFEEFAQVKNINIKSISVTDHAILRAKERLSWGKLKDTEIVGNLRAVLKNSTYIGEVIDNQHRKVSHMFASDRRAIYLSENYNMIVTVTTHEVVTYIPLKATLLELHKKEIRKLDRKQRAKERRFCNLKDDFKVDLAVAERRLNRTRSQSVINACKANIQGIHQTIGEYENEIKLIQDEKRIVARSMVAIT